MELRIQRKSSNHLYTVGIISVNNLEIAHTIESTSGMLPADKYQVRLIKDKVRRRVIGILKPSESLKPSETLKPTGWSIGIGHSWIGSRKHQVIAIGDVLIPGVVYRVTETYERLFDRIEKCEQRAEPITLTILDNQCIRNWPIRHWANVH